MNLHIIYIRKKLMDRYVLCGDGGHSIFETYCFSEDDFQQITLSKGVLLPEQDTH